MVQAGKVLLLEAIEPGVDGGEPRVLFPQLFCALLERVALHFHIYCWMPIKFASW